MKLEFTYISMSFVIAGITLYSGVSANRRIVTVPYERSVVPFINPVHAVRITKISYSYESQGIASRDICSDSQKVSHFCIFLNRSWKNNLCTMTCTKFLCLGWYPNRPKSVFLATQIHANSSTQIHKNWFSSECIGEMEILTRNSNSASHFASSGMCW